MKKIILICIATLLIAGCPTKTPPHQDSGAAQSIATYGADSQKILHEAERLGTLVSDGTLTRVQAAQALDTFRVNLVGHNSVDDATFSTYLRNTIDRQNGKISAQESVARMENNLKRLHLRWGNMKNKPANPAFTNFLMQVFKLPPLN